MPGDKLFKTVTLTRRRCQDWFTVKVPLNIAGQFSRRGIAVLAFFSQALAQDPIDIATQEMIQAARIDVSVERHLIDGPIQVVDAG